MTPAEAKQFLISAGKTLGNRGHLLIGVDTKKSPNVLHAAYNDQRGITAKFNLNILDRINRELNGNIDAQKFEHYAFYNAEKGCIEMHLICREQHNAMVDGVPIHFREGESIHTESSYKYTAAEFERLALSAGWFMEQRWFARDNLFAIYLLRNA